MKPSELKADIELQNLLKGKVFVVNEEGTELPVTVYTDGERSGLNVPDDFIDVMYSGIIRAIDVPMGFVKGYLVVTLYVKLNPDNTIKKNRVSKILEQFDSILAKCQTEHFCYEYANDDFITPTTAYTSIGYSTTILTLKWHTK